MEGKHPLGCKINKFIFRKETTKNKKKYKIKKKRNISLLKCLVTW